MFLSILKSNFQRNFSILFNKNNNINDKKITLGRWSIEKNLKKTNLKVDYANEDNCGVCTESGYKKSD
jgi:hypothetical protein